MQPSYRLKKATRENHAEPHERPALTARLTLSDAFLTGRTSTKSASTSGPDGLTASTTPGSVFPRSCSHSAFHHPCDRVIVVQPVHSDALQFTLRHNSGTPANTDEHHD